MGSDGKKICLLDCGRIMTWIGLCGRCCGLEEFAIVRRSLSVVSCFFDGGSWKEKLKKLSVVSCQRNTITQTKILPSNKLNNFKLYNVRVH